MQALKVVVVGDGAIGKTTFLISFTLDCFPQDYVPTVFDNFTTVYTLEDRPISLGLWDTAGQEDFAHIRPLSYPNTDVFLIMYSVAMRSSFENVKTKWIPEVKSNCPNTPFVLIGTQTDAREQKNPSHVSYKDGKKLCKEVGAEKYYELSSKENNSFKYVWDDILRFIINKHHAQKEPGKCCWSIHCHDNISLLSRVKCSGICGEWYCDDCIEHWADGWKGCIQCAKYEKSEREKNGKPEPVIKKKRISPEDKLEEHLKEFKIQYEKGIAQRKVDKTT